MPRILNITFKVASGRRVTGAMSHCSCLFLHITVRQCYRRERGLKVNAGKSKVMVLNGGEGFEYEVCVDGIHLEHASEFKHLALDESGTDEAECRRKVASGRRVAGAIRSLVSVLESCTSHCSYLFLRMVVRQ